MYLDPVVEMIGKFPVKLVYAVFFAGSAWKNAMNEALVHCNFSEKISFPISIILDIVEYKFFYFLLDVFWPLPWTLAKGFGLF